MNTIDVSNESQAGEMPPVCVLIPTFGSADLLQNCLRSLAAHAPADCTVYVLDDATPDDSIRQVCEQLANTALRLSYVRSDVNRGFVEMCNWGVETYWRNGMDLLLLNSDTEVTAGFLEEMRAVLHLHEKHGVVTPRSNNATIFSVPQSGSEILPQDSYKLWQTMRRHLPRYHVVPTAVGFCMLVKGAILAEFGLFDPVYSPGYNEENDLICRINRCGYSAAAANHAFVFHYESASFGPRKKALDKARREILNRRYPEYDRKVSDYTRFGTDPLERFAELLLPHRPKLLFDLYHLPAKHCGTSEFALNLLRELRPLAAQGSYDLYVGAGESQSFFADELSGYQVYDHVSPVPVTFDLVFKPSQIFTWREFQVMNRLAPRVAFTILDIIAVRCDYLGGPGRTILFRDTAQFADHVFAISRFSQDDFNAMYALNLTMRVVHLGTNFTRADRKKNRGEYVLIIGNQFAHKGVAETIARMQEDFSLLVLGPSNAKPHPNVHCLESGQINRRKLWEIITEAKAIVYPSHYEGFGLPVLDALALGIPIICRDNQVNREITGETDTRNLRFFSTTAEIPGLLQSILDSSRAPEGVEVRSWHDTASEYHAAFEELLSREIDVQKLRERTALLRLLESNGVM